MLGFFVVGKNRLCLGWKSVLNEFCRLSLKIPMRCDYLIVVVFFSLFLSCPIQSEELKAEGEENVEEWVEPVIST